MCGELDDRIFNKTYQFVTDIKKDELSAMKKKVREVKDDYEKKNIKSAIMATVNNKKLFNHYFRNIQLRMLKRN